MADPQARPDDEDGKAEAPADTGQNAEVHDPSPGSATEAAPAATEAGAGAAPFEPPSTGIESLTLSLANVPQTLDAIIDSFHAERPPEAAGWTGPATDGPGFVPPPRLAPLDLTLKAVGAPFEAPEDAPQAGPAGEVWATLEVQNTPESQPEGRLPGEPVAPTSPAAPGLAGDAGAGRDEAAPVGSAQSEAPPEGAADQAPAVVGPPPRDLMMPPFFQGETDAAESTMPEFAEPLIVGGTPSFAIAPESPDHAEPAEASDQPAYTEVSYTEVSYTETQYTEAPYTEVPYTETSYTEAPVYPDTPSYHDGPSYPDTPSYRDAPSYTEPSSYSEDPEPAGFGTEAGTGGFPYGSSVHPPLFQTVDRSAEPGDLPVADAATQIAVEANATAEALENLRLMLMQGAPGDGDAPHAAAPPARDREPLSLYQDTSPFGSAAMLPLPVPPNRGRSTAIYVLGFLAGIGLSVMAGVALFLLINMG
jgi:hypothetical protein